MESREDRNERRNRSLAAGIGTAFGIIAGAVVVAITQNPVWIALGIIFGPAFGIALAAIALANRR